MKYKVIIIDKELGEEEDEIFDSLSEAQLYWMQLHEDYNSSNLRIEEVLEC